MKYYIICFFFLFSSISVLSQQFYFPNGVYLSINQLKEKVQAFNINLNVIHRTKGELFWSGSNDYNIISTVDSINKKYINKKIFAYVKNDSLFLNCFPHKLSNGYALCITQGSFLVFKATVPNEVSSSRSATAGLLGGVIGGAIEGATEANKRYLYVLSLRTGNVRYLTKEYIIARLSENKLLLDQFKNEKKADSEAVLIKYIGFLNDITSIK